MQAAQAAAESEAQAIKSGERAGSLLAHFKQPTRALTFVTVRVGRAPA